MSSIGSVGGSDLNKIQLQHQVINKEEVKTDSTPTDKVDIQNNSISAGRNVVEKVLGSPVGLVTMAGKTVGGFFGGGVAAVERDKDDAEAPLAVTSGLAYTGMGVAAGLLLAGGWIPAVLGGAAGLGFALLSGLSGSMEKVSDKVGEKAAKSVEDNRPSDSKVRDTVKEFTEGGIVGAVTGGVEGLKQGTSYGAGIVSGVIEGTKGLTGSLLGTYETKEETEKPKDNTSFMKKVGKAMLQMPRKLSRFVAGTAVGLANGALGIVDGLIQGTAVGIADGHKAEKNLHTFIKGVQIVVAGGAAAAAFAGGGWMIAAGLGAGVIAAGILGAIDKGTDSAKDFADGLTKAVNHAKSDNAYSGEVNQYGEREKKTVYESFRDGIEGSLTGTGAGIREGFKEGYQQGAGVVDGLFDGVKGLGKGIAGGIKGVFSKAKPEAQQGEAALEEKPAKPETDGAKETKATFGQKLIQFPGKVLKAVMGTAIGLASGPLHLIPGSIQGLIRGSGGDGNRFALHSAMFLQNVGTAAAAGFVLGGPGTAALAGAGALVFTGLTTYMGEKTGVYEKLEDSTNEKIKLAKEDNKGTKVEVAFQNATEGAVIGGLNAVAKGFSVGYDSGSGAVSGAADVMEGGLEGLYQVGKNVVNLAKKK